MPIMRGPSPVRRTIGYLLKSRLVLKDRVRIVTVNYNTKGDHHKGARDFVFWTLPQLQFKNPSVQMVTMTNVTPSPYMTFFLEDGDKVLVDLDSKTRIEIEDHLKNVLCKTKEQLKQIALQQQKKDNPANFGFECEKNCMCIIPGQVPCPGVVFMPYHMRGRFVRQQKFDDDMERLETFLEQTEEC